VKKDVAYQKLNEELKQLNPIKLYKCTKCGVEEPIWCIIDNWCIIDGENYCIKCQEKYKVGWYEPKKK
jgi:hypothetical protein